MGEPHIPGIKWDIAWCFFDDKLCITNTNVTTFVFFVLVLIVVIIWHSALKSGKNSKIKTFFLHSIWFLYDYIIWAFWSREKARLYFPIVAWLFVIIICWNLFWLFIDWIWLSLEHKWSEIFLHYFRPMNSDLATTAALASISIFLFIAIWIYTKWFWHWAKWYLFNFTWDWLFVKIINVFVWWLHIISIPSSFLSLSLRLFWNILAWVILISVITWLWAYATQWAFWAWRLVSLPFYAFEIFVAFIQAFVFSLLTISYFNQAMEEH